MKYPKHIKHRGRVLATIYGKSENYTSYRVAWNISGRRRMKAFRTYSQAKNHADELVKELAKGSDVTALTPGQARDALAALQVLENYRQRTGENISILASVSEYTETRLKLNGYTLREASEGFLRTVVSIQRKDVTEAVEEFIKANIPHSQPTEGRHHSQHAAKYKYNRDIQLRRFSASHPNTALCDLTKGHLDIFMGSMGDFSPKTRNHYRASIRQFLEWAVRKDYLSPTHRIGEADGLRSERANTSEVGFYTPVELGDLLENADGPMRALIAIGGLAGLRTAELLRLDWADVWHVSRHIEVTARKSKTRARRLVEICPALAAWLKKYKSVTAGKIWNGHEVTFQEQFGRLCTKVGITRKINGLRHAYCTYHYALKASENLTAAQAGNSPAMIHAHYKGLATKKDAQKWFSIKPKATAKIKGNADVTTQSAASAQSLDHSKANHEKNET